MPRIAIGIQARSTSKRLPEKVLMKIENMMMIDRVYNACVESAQHLNRQKPSSKDGKYYERYDISVHLLLPTHDKLYNMFKVIRSVINYDDENDVLSRYLLAQKETNADYIVRITADCIQIPTHMISRAIKNAVIKDADYTSNVVHRTSCEGFDVEVLSKNMLEYLDHLAGSDPHAREHVTIALVNDILERPEYYKQNFVVWHLFEHYDFSGIKTSVDTMNDFEIAKRNLESVARKKREASRSGFVSK